MFSPLALFSKEFSPALSSLVDTGGGVNIINLIYTLPVEFVIIAVSIKVLATTILPLRLVTF